MLAMDITPNLAAVQFLPPQERRKPLTPTKRHTTLGYAASKNSALMRMCPTNNH